jgi:hypothetical protein
LASDLILASLKELWIEVEAIWEANQHQPEYTLYVSADYQAIYDQLCRLRGRATTFLEWGSGLGVVTIMANRLGFDSYGIEAESRLVCLAEGLAKKYHANPTFAIGSFIPTEYQENLAAGVEFGRTLTEHASAYEDLDMELRDFDLVYAYPWPDEHRIYRHIMQRHAADNALYMRYDAREGLSLTRIANKGRRKRLS